MAVISERMLHGSFCVIMVHMEKFMDISSLIIVYRAFSNLKKCF